MKKLFTFSVDNMIDLITNSSSELFVFRGNTKAELEEMIEQIYPEYRTEYETPVRIDEATNEQIDTYISSHYCGWSNSRQEMEMNLIPGFTFDEMYEVHKHYSHPRDITPETRERYIDAISPNRNLYFLFSIEENPNWDMQQKLEEVGVRYHLG